MTQKQIELLNKMKKLVREGKRKFKEREDRDYLKDLLELGLSVESAWNEHILFLNKNFFFIDPKPNYKTDNNTLVFKKMINGNLAYIKLKILIGKEEKVECWSFHKDEERRN